MSSWPSWRCIDRRIGRSRLARKSAAYRDVTSPVGVQVDYISRSLQFAFTTNSQMIRGVFVFDGVVRHTGIVFFVPAHSFLGYIHLIVERRARECATYCWQSGCAGTAVSMQSACEEISISAPASTVGRSQPRHYPTGFWIWRGEPSTIQ